MFDRPIKAGANAVSTQMSSESYSTQPPSTRDIGQIVLEGRTMEKGLSVLHEEIDGLEAVLTLMLRPSGPIADANGVPVPPRSVMADGLAEANRRIHDAVVRLATIRQRIDV